MAAVNGVATFTNLFLDVAGTYTLVPSTAGLSSFIPGALVISPAAASQFVVSGPAKLTKGTPGSFVVKAEDAFGNVVTGYNGTVQATTSESTSTTHVFTAGDGGIYTFPITLNTVSSTASVTFNDAAKGITASVTGISVISTSLATVNGTFGVKWGAAGVYNTLSTQADGLRLLPANRSTDVPWLNIYQISFTLSQPATLSAADVKVTGIAVTSYAVSSVTGTGTAADPIVVTLSQPISLADRVTLTAGNANVATFARRLDVLPGDVNDDGSVGLADANAVRAMYTTGSTSIPWVFGDVLGDVAIGTAPTVNDYNAVRSRFTTVLPPIPPG